MPTTGELSYIRHTAKLLDSTASWPLPDNVATFEALASDLFLLAYQALEIWPDCRAAADTERRGCLISAIRSASSSRLIATNIEYACTSPERGYDSAVQIIGCLLTQWQSAWDRVVQLDDHMIRSVPCSYPGAFRQRQINILRLDHRLQQARALVMVTDWSDNDLGTYAMQLRQEEKTLPEKLEREMTGYGEDLAHFEVFSETLAQDPGSEKIGTLIAISTAQQRFAACLDRHPNRQAEWQALAEPQSGGVPSWTLAPVATATEAQPIDLTAAAHRKLNAMSNAHAPRPPTAEPTADLSEATEKAHYNDSGLCSRLGMDQQFLKSNIFAKEREIAAMQSAFTGCGDEFVAGATGYLSKGQNPLQMAQNANQLRNSPKLGFLGLAIEGIVVLSWAGLNMDECVAQNRTYARKFDPDRDSLILPGLENLGRDQARSLAEQLRRQLREAQSQFARNCVFR
ncbi:MAG: hypothetical protein OTI35_15155 [Sulfitobacter sp.]|nr:hypothetical protein [Sulfitobacter sp.]